METDLRDLAFSDALARRLASCFIYITEPTIGDPRMVGDDLLIPTALYRVKNTLWVELTVAGHPRNMAFAQLIDLLHRGVVFAA